MLQHAIFCLLATLIAVVTPGAGQDVPASPTVQVTVVDAERTRSTGHAWARTDGEVHGRLAFLSVDIECEAAPARQVRRALARALGLNLVDHFPREMDGLVDVDLSLRSIPAVEALELVISSTSGPNRGTWQVRDGVVEVGPRDVLARRTEPITRVIEVTDLLLEPPDFVPTGMAASFIPGMNAGQKTHRDTPREIGARLLETIVRQVEPDAWRALNDAERADGLPDPVDPRDPFGGRNLDPNRLYPNSRREAPIFVQGRWASISLRDRAIVVRGPAFVLRGIEGLPEPVPPPASIVQR